MVRTTIVLGGLLIVLMLDIAASVRACRWGVVTSSQKAAWFVFIWSVPLLGSLLALQITAETMGAPLPDNEETAAAMRLALTLEATVVTALAEAAMAEVGIDS